MTKTTDPELGIPKMAEESADKVVKVQKQVEDVKGIMEKNMQAAMTRGERLEDLEAKTTALEEGSKAFSRNTRTVRSKLWWKNLKYWAILIGIIALIVLVIVFSVFGKDIFHAVVSLFSSSTSSSGSK